VKWLMRVYNY